LDTILKKSKDIGEFRVYDTDSKWNDFLKSVGEDIATKETKTTKRPLIYYITNAAAAIFVLGLFFTIALWPEPKLRDQITATSSNQQIELVDGTKIVMDQGATVDYPLSFTGQDERFVRASGHVAFDVRKSILPFKVEYEDLLIEVLGTKFRLSKDKSGILIENTEGSVKVSQLDDAENVVILSKGDKFEYGDGLFKDLNSNTTASDGFLLKGNLESLPLESDKHKEKIKEGSQIHSKIQSKEDNSSIFTLGSLLKNHLVKYNKKTVKVDKKFKYDPKKRVRVDITRPYNEVIEALKDQGVIGVKKGKCPDCYIITSPEEGE